MYLFFHYQYSISNIHLEIMNYKIAMIETIGGYELSIILNAQIVWFIPLYYLLSVYYFVVRDENSCYYGVYDGFLLVLYPVYVD